MKVVPMAPQFAPVSIMLESKQDVENMREVCKHCKHRMIELNTCGSELERWQYDLWYKLGHHLL